MTLLEIMAIMTQMGQSPMENGEEYILMKRIISLILVLVLALSLVACGAPKEEAPKITAEDVAGNWVLGNVKQVFNADGTGVITMGNGITMACDWTYSNGKITIGYAMGEKEATITMNEDGTLVLHYDGGDYTKEAK